MPISDRSYDEPPAAAGTEPDADQTQPEQPEPGTEARQRLPKGLVLVSTPIGNLGDISARGVAVLRQAALVLCEDTRTTARLLGAYGITAHTAALHEHNEDAQTPMVLELLREGRMVALVSDAGTPLVSDPGYRLVRAALAEGLPVGGVPGANAAVLALTLSGLPPQPFLFMGFLPPKGGARRAVLAGLRAAERAGLSATLVFYEAPHRLAETLADMAVVLGDRPAAVAREMTKRFEEVRRAGLAELAAHYAEHAARGEICVVVGPGEALVAADEDVEGLLREAMGRVSLKQAVAEVTAKTGLPRKVVYAAALGLGEG
jgi:16S rRNA (cytidine1402-2'-O)-methyltransferase